MQMKGIFGSIAILVGTAVGAGIFGIPYAFAHVGVPAGLFYLFFLGGGVILVSLAYGEVVLRTPDKHQFFGYAQIYLGKFGRISSIFILIFSTIGTLIAYIIEVGAFSHALFNNLFGGLPIYYSLIFFILASAAVYFGLGMVVKLEKFMVFLLLLTVLIICLWGLPALRADNLVGPLLDLNYILPYGVILFAVGAAGIIPELKDSLNNKRKLFAKVIIIGLGIAVIVYAVFATVVVGVSGKNTTDSALIGLGQILGTKMLYLGTIFGILAMTTSFLSVGLVLRDAYIRDFKLTKILAWLLVFLPPLIIVLLNLVSFITVIGLVGAIFGSFEAIVILLMWIKAKKYGKRKPEYQMKFPSWVLAMLFLIFFVGFITTMIDVF